MIRVAFTSLAPFISGAERSLQVTLRHLPAARVEPLVIGPAGAKIAPWCKQNGVPFLACPLAFRDKWHPLRWWQSARAMRRLLRDNRIDVVHANQMWSYPAAGAAGRSLDVPRVCHLRDETDAATLRWCCAAGVEAVIGISQHMTRQAEAAWPAGPDRPLLATLINPVELPDPVDAAEAIRLRIEARRSFGIADHGVVIGFIGQLREVKGLLGLLDVLASLTSRRTWHILVAGRDPNPGASFEKACRERAARSDLVGRVTFAGFLDDPERFYRAIDLAIVPSREEPLGRVPLEAAAFGKPSAAFAVGGLPDTIQDGETGWLVPPGDWPRLGAVLGGFLEAPDQINGQAPRAWVESVAEPAAYARQLAELYQNLLRRTARTAQTPPATCASC